MKNNEKQIFDKYGNYNFPTEIKQDGLNTATTQIEEMAKVIETANENCIIYKDGSRPWKEHIARVLFNQGYRKLPEDSVVLTNDNAEDLANLIITSPQMQSVMSDLIKAWQKETTEKIIDFIETLKVKEDGRHQWREDHNNCIDKVTLKLNQKFINGVEIKE